MTANISISEVEAALEGMRTMLEPDGYGLAVHVADKLRVEIVATPAACADCLVPKEVMVGVVVSMLNDGGITLAESEIELAYPADV